MRMNALEAMEAINALDTVAFTIRGYRGRELVALTAVVIPPAAYWGDSVQPGKP